MLNRLDIEIQPVINFLRSRTPESWLHCVQNNIPLLLVDHAHCERKAAAAALNFMSKYPEKPDVISLMSPLAREELLHFEKVIQILQKRGIEFGPLQPSGYGSNLHQLTTNRDGLDRLRDQLIIGAIIEARSCERFYAILPYLNDPELEKFYSFLIKSEARHFEGYLNLAHKYGNDVEQRLNYFLDRESIYIESHDTMFRFHSGIPEA